MGCASSRDVSELREGLEVVQQQQTEILQAIASLGRRLSQGEDKDGGLGAGQVDVQGLSSGQVDAVMDSLASLEKGLSLLLVKAYEPVTKTIERKHRGIRRLTEQISSHLRTVQTPDGRTPDKVLRIQKQLQDMETRFAELASPLTTPR